VVEKTSKWRGWGEMNIRSEEHQHSNGPFLNKRGRS
jgi:hypothetical protein